MKKQIIITICMCCIVTMSYADITKAKQLITVQDFESAIGELKNTLIEEPNNYEAMDMILPLYEKTKKYRSYIYSVNNFLAQKYPINKVFFKNAIQYSLKYKEYQLALKFTRQLNSEQPIDDQVMNYMGLALYGLEQYGIAQGAFQFAIAINPHNAAYYLNHAKNSRALKNNYAFKYYLQQAVKIDPGLREAQMELEQLSPPKRLAVTVPPVVAETKTLLNTPPPKPYTNPTTTVDVIPKKTVVENQKKEESEVTPAVLLPSVDAGIQENTSQQQAILPENTDTSTTVNQQDTAPVVDPIKTQETTEKNE